MDDNRGLLALQFLKLLDRTRARWVVWENVPGVLSSSGGRDFGSFLGGLVERGYGFAYRVLDAQHFGVPQRRRRVFVVGHLGDWRRAAAVLFERHSLSGHPAPRREKGQGVSGSLKASLGKRCGQADGANEHDLLIPSTGETSHCLNAGGIGRQDYETETLITHSLRAEGFDASEDGTGRGTPLVPIYVGGGSYPTVDDDGGVPTLTGRKGDQSAVCFTAKDHGADASDISPTLRSGGHSGSHANGGVMPAVAFNITPSNSNKDYNARQSERAQALTASGNRPSVRGGDLIATSAVRRLTPLECERLMGLPDHYTAVPYRGKLAADGPRYKALGNSMAVPVMAWIGARIAAVEAIAEQELAA
jgi:DNA (cytosine-5)-methyltransferase 1